MIPIARPAHLAMLALALGAVAGCATRPLEGCRPGVFPRIDCRPSPPADPGLMLPAPDAAARKQVQTRRFAGMSEADLLAASVAVLQDQGFQITTSVASLGLVSGRKMRPSEEAVSDLGRQLLPGMGRAFLQALTFGAVGDRDITQQIRVANAFRVVLSTRPAGGEEPAHEVRVIFYREYVGAGTRDAILSPVLYQEFFGLLGQALVRARRGD